MQERYDQVLKYDGKELIPLSGVVVTVKNYPSLTTATIYSDDGITPKTNPTTTDLDGNFNYFAANGKYIETFVYNSADVTPSPNPVRILYDPAGGLASTIIVEDEGTPLGAAGTANFVGAGVTATFTGGVATVTIPGASSGTGITIKDEGTQQGTALAVTSINVVGPTVSATVSGADATFTVSPGSGINAFDHSTSLGVATGIKTTGDLKASLAAGVMSLVLDSARPWLVARFNASGVLQAIANGSCNQSGDVTITHSGTGTYLITANRSATTNAANSPIGAGFSGCVVDPSNNGFVSVVGTLTLTSSAITFTVNIVNDTGSAVDRGFSITIY